VYIQWVNFRFAYLVWSQRRDNNDVVMTQMFFLLNGLHGKRFFYLHQPELAAIWADQETRAGTVSDVPQCRIAVLLLFVVVKVVAVVIHINFSVVFAPVESMMGVRVRHRFRSPSSVRLFVYTSCACRVCVRACVRACVHSVEVTIIYIRITHDARCTHEIREDFRQRPSNLSSATSVIILI